MRWMLYLVLISLRFPMDEKEHAKGGWRYDFKQGERSEEGRKEYRETAWYYM